MSLGSWFDKIYHEAKKVLHLEPTNEQRRQEERHEAQQAASEAELRRQINDQINAYREQTELTRNQLNEARATAENEQRRIQEKQIRTLRRSSRAQGIGMLGQGAPAAQDIGTKLGG